MSTLKVDEIQTTSGVQVMTSDQGTKFHSIMKVNEPSTSSTLTIDSTENAIICGPFTAVDIEVNGNLTVTQSLTFTANLTIATGKSVQVL